LSIREAYASVPVEIHPAKSSLFATGVSEEQFPVHIHNLVSAPPPQEEIFIIPEFDGVKLYHPAAVASGCEAKPVKVVAVNDPGVTGNAVEQSVPCAFVFWILKADKTAVKKNNFLFIFNLFRRTKIIRNNLEAEPFEIC
jgi:hypothetical protein